MSGTSLPLFDQDSIDLLIEAVADPGYGVFPDFLTAEVQQGLIQLMAHKVAADSLVRAGVGAGARVRSEIRSDSIFWLEADDPAPMAVRWLAGMDTLCGQFRRALFLPLWTYEGHLARYPRAGFYKVHLDQHAQTMARQISVIAYLNEDWEDSDGGELRIFTDVEKGVEGPFLEVLPRAGTVVIFRSGEFWHEVQPAKRERLSLTGWLRGREKYPVV